MKISIISKGAARSRWAELFYFFLAVATASSLSSVVVVADEADLAYLQPTLRQSSNFYASNHRALMRDDEQPSEEPDVASIINGTATGGPLSYQVGLAREAGKLPSCGGSLIAPQVVLTAAHCVVDEDYTPLDPPANKVLINSYNLSSFDNGIPNGGGIIQASSYVIHPDFSTTTYENDIALWFLPFPIAEDEHFKFATLNEDPNVPADNETLFVSGWGKTSPLPGDDRSRILLGTNVDYITNEQCQTDYDAVEIENTPDTITNDMMCAYRGGTGHCTGDSGGPLMIANSTGTAPAMTPPIQAGIVSWSGKPCGTYPGVYTRVSSYIDWIHSTACEEVGELCSSSSKSSKSKSYKNDRP